MQLSAAGSLIDADLDRIVDGDGDGDGEIA